MSRAELNQAFDFRCIKERAPKPRRGGWPEVNLFGEHGRIVQLESLRRGIRGTSRTWVRILSCKGEAAR